MIEYITEKDLHLINKALNDGQDVRIQKTRDGYRIVKDYVSVIKKENIKKNKSVHKEVYGKSEEAQ